MAITVMQRSEMKYILTSEQKEHLTEKLKGYMQIDQYGKTSIASLYYDTPTYQLVRTSMEKPPFKEKIRLRSYGLATEESPVFLELKRKAYGIVYKRRIETTIPQVNKFFSGEKGICVPGQISSEIVSFRDFYKKLVPSCLIIYDRTAYFEPGGDLRLTIDENPRYRTNDLSLTKSMDGIPLLDRGCAVLEIKVQDSIPLWLAGILSAEKIVKGSFSKYGEAYRRQLINAHTA